jgi:alanyl-tRNA synthetase
MTNWGYEGNDGTGQGETTELNGPKALRDAYEAMKKQNDELNQKLTSFLEEQTASKMATVFESLGVPGAQAVYQGPADPQKAKEWVETMRSTFGGTQGGTPPIADAQHQAPPVLDQNAQAQFERFSEAGQTGTPVGNFEAAQQGINGASSTDEIIAAFQRMNHMG